MFTARDIHYEVADRTRGISSGGLGALHALARQVGLIDAIDRGLHLLKFHFPYHESDHVLTFAYNALCDGTCVQDLELRRHDEWWAARTGRWRRGSACCYRDAEGQGIAGPRSPGRRPRPARRHRSSHASWLSAPRTPARGPWRPLPMTARPWVRLRLC